MTRERRESLLETLSLASFWHQRKILKNEGAGWLASPREGKRARVGRNSFNWKSEETRCRGRDTMWTGGLESAERRTSGGPIAVVLYPRARSTPYVSPVPLPSCYIHFRAYVGTCTSGQGRSEMRWNLGEDIKYITFYSFFF